MQDRTENSRASRSTAGDDAVATTRRPLRAEVYEKQLTGVEQAVVLAMLETGDSSGQHLYIRIPRIAAWSKFDEKSVQRALWGDHRTHPGRPKPRGAKGKPEPECPFCKGLVQRRVLQQLSPANWKERKPAVYRLNVEILDACQAVRRYLDQKKLDFPKTRKAFDPAPHGRGVQRPTVAGSSVPRSGDPASHGRTDSKAIYSTALDSREGDSPKTAPPPSQRDFDERDLRRMAEARREAEKRPSSVGCLSDTAYFEWICAHAGITVQRGLHLQQLQVAWPETHLPAIPEPKNELEINRAMQECRAWDAARTQNGNREK